MRIGTITPGPRKERRVGHRAEVVRKRWGDVVLKLVETFDRRAASWIVTKENELDRPGSLEAASAAKKCQARSTLGDAIVKTLAGRIKEVGRTTKVNLRITRRHILSGALCDDVESRHIVDFARDRLGEGPDPATVGKILSGLGKVFSPARPAWGFQLSPRPCQTHVPFAESSGSSSARLSGRAGPSDLSPRLGPR